MKNKQTSQLLTVARIKPLALTLMIGPAVSLPISAGTLIDLGKNISPKAINNNGLVVGASNTDQYPATAFSWSLENGFELIGGGISANTVNDNDLIAGSTLDGAFVGSHDWSNYGALGINLAGTVAGYQIGTNPYQPRSLPYNPAIFNGIRWKTFDIARLYSRGTRQGVYADRFILNAINVNGLSVGYKYRYGLAGSSAILIDTNAPVNDYSDVFFLSTPAGGQATDINDNNIVAGMTGSNSRTTPITYTQAFKYDYDTDNLLILPILEGGLRSSAFDINEQNQLVGQSESTAGTHAVLWNENGEIVDLNDRLTTPGWVLSSATAMNDRGDITGTGLFNGIAHGFVLTNSTVTPPPPTENLTPEAVASADRLSGKAPLTVNFDASASIDHDGSIVSYLWEFMDGSSSTTANSSHIFTSPNTYLVMLTVTDNQGAMHSTQVAITVRKSRGKGK